MQSLRPLGRNKAKDQAKRRKSCDARQMGPRLCYKSLDVLTCLHQRAPSEEEEPCPVLPPSPAVTGVSVDPQHQGFIFDAPRWAPLSYLCSPSSVLNGRVTLGQFLLVSDPSLSSRRSGLVHSLW